MNLAKKVGAHYFELGVMLLQDDGEQITAIENELRGNAERINYRVFQCWLRGDGLQPVTWDTLVTVLQDMDLAKLAHKISVVKQ